MKNLILEWLVYALAIGISAYLLPGVSSESVVAVLVLAIVLGVINAFVRPILVVLTLPITILTLGIFILILDTLLIWAGSALVPGFFVDGFWWAFLFSIVLTIISAFLHLFIKDEEQDI